jgi:hypothetical protein
MHYTFYSYTPLLLLFMVPAIEYVCLQYFPQELVNISNKYFCICVIQNQHE